MYKRQGLNRTDCRIFLKETYGQDFPYDYFREQTAAVFQRKMAKDGLPVMKGAGELLAWLQEKGLKVALASSTSHKTVESHLQQAGFTGFFQAVDVYKRQGTGKAQGIQIPGLCGYHDGVQ